MPRKPGRPLGSQHDQRTRDKIKTSQIINRLYDHILGENKMEATQVSAALGLLKKTLPDLQSIEMKAEVEQTQKVVSSEPLTTDEWSAKYGSDMASTSGTTKSIN